MVTQETYCPLILLGTEPHWVGKPEKHKSHFLAHRLVVKHIAEVKAFRLPCGNLAVIYTSSSSSLQGAKGCLGEARFTLQRTGSITAHFAACWQGTIPAFVSHPPSPPSTGSTAWSPSSAHMSPSGSKARAREGCPAVEYTVCILQG